MEDPLCKTVCIGEESIALTCCSLANSTLSVVEFIDGLIEVTAEATSMCRVHRTGYPAR